jgi:hypothetical protein
MGPVAIMLDASSSGPKPWLQLQITAEGEAMAVTGR